MGSFPHEFRGYRHVSDDAARAHVRDAVGRAARRRAGPAHPQHVRRRARRRVQGHLHPGRGHRSSPIPNTQHVTAGLAAMECVVVQDLFLNETANYAHVFLPGSSFLEKDGTFTNAERRIQPRAQGDGAAGRLCGLGDHRCCSPTRSAIRCTTTIRREIMDEIARADADLRRRLATRSSTSSARIQWPCNDDGAGRHADHAHRRLRARQGQVRHHRIRADRREDRPALPAAAHHRPHPQRSTTSARRRGAPRTSSGTRRTCSRSIRTTPRSAASATATGCGSTSRAGETTLRAHDHRARRAGRGLHHLPPSRDAAPTSSPPSNSDWATNCPEYKVTAVQVMPSNGPSEWQEEYEELSRQARRIAEPLVAAE